MSTEQNNLADQIRAYIAIREVQIPIYTEQRVGVVKLHVNFKNTQLTFTSSDPIKGYVEMQQFIEEMDTIYKENNKEFSPFVHKELKEKMKQVEIK